VDEPVDHGGGGDDLVAEDVAQRPNGRFEVTMTEACSQREATSWKHSLAASVSNGM
jgi:hypothetical protein